MTIAVVLLPRRKTLMVLFQLLILLLYTKNRHGVAPTTIIRGAEAFVADRSLLSPLTRKSVLVQEHAGRVLMSNTHPRTPFSLWMKTGYDALDLDPTSSSSSSHGSNTTTRPIVDKEGPSARENSDDFIYQAFQEEQQDKSNQEFVVPKQVIDPHDNALPNRPDQKDLGTATVSISTSFPLSLFVNHELVKEALKLVAINPRIGGILLYGGHGTGKSVLARSIQDLLPSSSITTVPLNVMEEALIGTVDVEQSLATGKPHFSPGLLAKSHDTGVLLVDDMNLLEETTASILWNAIADGFVKVEREGLSCEYPCRPILVGTFNPNEEGGELLRDHWMDRVGISLPVDCDNLTLPERVQVVENVEGYMDRTMTAATMDDTDPSTKENNNGGDQRKIIQEARQRLAKVQIDQKQILYLCEESTRAGCEGQRAEIFATEIAKASAAYHGRDHVNADDLRKGLLLAIVPRGLYAYELPDDQRQEEMAPPPPPPSPQEQVSLDDTTPEQEPQEQPQEEDQTDDMENTNEKEEDAGSWEETEDTEESEEEHEEKQELLIPQTFLFGVDAVPIDPQIMLFQQWARRGKGGKRSKIFNLKRGRFVKAIFPKDGVRQGRIAVGATLRAAAPHQLNRRRRAKETNTKKADEAKLIYVKSEDFRLQRLARKAGSLVIFVVDASGSMAINRMGAAKGAAVSLLQEAYKSRDKIALVEFHGNQADILVPPTKSIALTKSRLEAMPCGGNSPLAHALTTAIRVGLNAIKVKQDVARVVIVLLTDGRANVPMFQSMGEPMPAEAAIENDREGNSKSVTQRVCSKKFLKDEVLAIGKQLGALPDFNFLCIDTEDKFVGTGMSQELARVAQGHFHRLSFAESKAVTKITQDAMRQVH